MICYMKDEPEWMRAYRLHSLEHFQQRPLPTWGANLAQIDFNDIYYYLKPTEKKQRSWDEVPENIKNTLKKWGSRRRSGRFWPGRERSKRRSLVNKNRRAKRL